jgi:valyl-tRNA synthetase
MEFGSGAMTITPAHSAIDFEIAQRHHLDIEPVIDERGVLLPIAGEFAGQHIKKARAAIVEKLKTKGLVTKIDENYLHNVATNSRGGGIIEPQIKEQWFVDVNKRFKIKESSLKNVKSGQEVSLKELMKSVVESGEIKIEPERFEKIYFHWIDNLRDWCISRQLWFGHRIPVWYRPSGDHPEGGKEIYCDINPPKGDGWQQDPDTLDTWFSSGLWTFSTLGWPEQTKDLQTFHPTSLMMPGYEILFFWVARMILMSTYLLGQIPFRQVVLHGIVRDSKGRKFSKSLDNGIDPLEMTAKYGTDALRMALIFGSGPGNDTVFDEQRVKGMKHFANKLWNIARYVLANIDASVIPASEPESNQWILKLVQDDKLTEADKLILQQLEATKASVTTHLDNFRLHEAAQDIYQFTWRELADVYVEASKKQLADENLKENTQKLLLHNLINVIKLLHPFMPFITEELWSILNSANLLGKDPMLMVSKWPIPNK